MKVTQTVTFETSDGRTFKEPGPAKEHEVGLLAASLRPADAQRLTALELTRLLCDNPGRFIALLSQFGEDAPQEAVVEVLAEAKKAEPDGEQRDPDPEPKPEKASKSKK